MAFAADDERTRTPIGDYARMAIGMTRVPPRPLAWVLAVTAAAYLPTLFNGFAWDDLLIVLQVPAYRSFDIAAIFASPANTLEYLPVRDLTLAIDFMLWGEWPAGFHLTNLMWHLAVVAMAFTVAAAIAKRVGEADAEYFATLVAAVVGWHPLHAEPVNFIATRNTLMASFFLLVAVHFFLRDWDRERRISPTSTAAALLAVFSKASVVFLPGVLVLLVLALGRTRAAVKRGLALAAPVVIIALAAAGVHLWVASRSSVIALAAASSGLGDPLALAARLMLLPCFYAGKFLFPWPLSIAYPPEVVFGESPGVRAILVLVAGVGCVYGLLRLRKASRLPLIGLGWFLMALVPVLSIAGNATLVADRYAYAANFGLAIVLASIAGRVTRRLPALGTPLLAVFLVWLVIVVGRGADWNNDMALKEAAYRAYPQAGRLMYADALTAAGRDRAAFELYRDAPADPMRHYFSGLLNRRQGRLTEAVADFRAALSAAGDHGQILIVFGETLEADGNDDEAMRIYRRVFALPPAQSAMGNHRQRAVAGRQRIERRLQPRLVALEAAVTSAPDDYTSRFALAILLATLGRTEDAAIHYRQAGRLAPERWEPWYNLALMHAGQGEFAAARVAMEAALARNPQNGQAQLRLGMYLVELQQTEAATSAFRRALAIDSGLLEAAWQLAQLDIRAGRYGQARQWLEFLRGRVPDSGDMRQRIDRALSEVSGRSRQ